MAGSRKKKKEQEAPAPPSRSRSKDHGLLRRALRITVYLGVLGCVGLALYTLFLIPLTPDLRTIDAVRTEHPSIVLSADGQEITRFQRVNRRWIPLDRISDHVVAALIATEDARFYRHRGIDYLRLFSSVGHSLLGDAQGASTLTMQLARNIFPEEIGKSDPLTRKLKELITAVRIEQKYTKREIIETYLNTVPFLYNAFGIELGARTYFDKPASELTLEESATLVGMLKGNAYYNPVRAPERAHTRRNVVLLRMVSTGRLPRATYERVRDRPIALRFEPQPIRGSLAPHYTERVRRMVTVWADQHGKNIYADGLIIRTPLDAHLQRQALAAVNRYLPAFQDIADVEWSGPEIKFVSDDLAAYRKARPGVRAFQHFWNENPGLLEAYARKTDRYRGLVEGGQGPDAALDAVLGNEDFVDSLQSVHQRVEAGFVALDPRTGDVKAWVGSRDFASGAYDHVADARRQPGSTFKPFVYAAALEHGYTPEFRFPDRAVEIRMADGKVWRPTNADGYTGLDMTLRDGLALSKNTITAQLMEGVGPSRTADYARNMGITDSPLEEVPSLALGTSPVSLLELTSAYGTIASGGVWHQPRLLTVIESRDGQVLARFGSESRVALSNETSLNLIDMLRGTVDYGTARRIRTTFGIEADVAGKTGTTQDNADGWFVLMHPELVGAAWIGFNDQRIRFRSDFWGQGAHNALYVVGDVYRQAFASGEIRRTTHFPPPPEIYQDEYQRRESFLAWIGRMLRGEQVGPSPDRPTRKAVQERPAKKKTQVGKPTVSRRKSTARVKKETSRVNRKITQTKPRRVVQKPASTRKARKTSIGATQNVASRTASGKATSRSGRAVSVRSRPEVRKPVKRENVRDTEPPSEGRSNEPRYASETPAVQPEAPKTPAKTRRQAELEKLAERIRAMARAREASEVNGAPAP